MKQNKGITLIALVVTIVVLLILAAVTINIIFGKNGVISKAQEAALQTKIGAVKEKVAMEMVDLETDSTLTGNPLTAEIIIEHFENLDWVGSATKESDDTVRIISTDSVIIDIKVTSNGGYELISQGVDDGEPYPTMTIEQLPTEGIAGEKIKIKVTASVEQTKETTGITTIENVTTGETKDYTEGGVIFEVLTNGEYTFKATTNKGKTKTAKINVNIAEGGAIGITIEPTTPRNTTKTETQNGIETGPIKVNISYGKIELTNTDKYQYRIGTKGEWQTSNSNQITVDATENTIIVARYYDGKNSIGVQNYSIQNVDNVAPNSFTPTVTETTTDSITVSASTTDTASEGAGESIAGILRYEYSIDESSWQTTNTLQNLSDGTSYTVHVKAIDKAGNETIGQVSAQTQVLATDYLVDKVSAGDYVAYKAGTWTSTVALPNSSSGHGSIGGYTAGQDKAKSIQGATSGWRVLYKNGSGATGTVVLVSAGIPALAYYGSASSSNASSMVSRLNTFAQNNYMNSTFASSVRCFDNADRNYVNTPAGAIGYNFWDADTWTKATGTLSGSSYSGYEWSYFWMTGDQYWGHFSSEYKTVYSNCNNCIELNYVPIIAANGDVLSSGTYTHINKWQKTGNTDEYLYSSNSWNSDRTAPAGNMICSSTRENNAVYYYSTTYPNKVFSNYSAGFRPVVVLKAGVRTMSTQTESYLGQTCWAIYEP